MQMRKFVLFKIYHSNAFTCALSVDVTEQSSLQKEMSFECYSSLPYNDKLARCNNALKLLQGRQ